MLPVAVHTPVAGLYSSALAALPWPKPPATSTCPFASNVAVCQKRTLAMLVAVHTPLPGSYSSALVKSSVVLLRPPATSTCPFGSNVAVCEERAVTRSPVALHLPGGCAGTDGLSSAAALSAAAALLMGAKAKTRPAA